MTAPAASSRPADRLAGEGPAEQDGHGGVDVGVGRDEDARSAAAQEPAVRGEGDDRAEDDEIGERGERAGRDRGRVDAAELSHRHSRDGKERRSAEHLHRRRQERRRGKRRDARIRRAGGPGKRGAEDDRGTDRIEMCALADEQHDSEQAGGNSGECAERQLDAEEGAVEDRREQRHACHEQRRQPGGDPLLGPGDAARVDEQEQPADDRRGRPLTASRTRPAQVAPPRGPAVEERPRQPEPNREHQQRRQGLVGDGDREVRRSPDDVDDAERGGDLRSHGSMVPSGLDQHKLSYCSYRS